MAKMKILAVAGLCVGLIWSTATTFAATITFDGPDTSPYLEDGFSINPARTVNGNCGIDNPCLALNDNETSTLALVGGGVFTLDSFWFKLLGDGTPNALIVTPYIGSIAQTAITLAVGAVYDHNTGYIYTGPIANITSLVFSTIDGGNVRIDDISVSAVPLPAALPLLGAGLAGLGGMSWLKRRRARRVVA